MSAAHANQPSPRTRDPNEDRFQALERRIAVLERKAARLEEPGETKKEE